MPLTKVRGNGLGTLNTADLDGAVTVNDSSADVDFRVESNGNANMLVVDAGNDKVGIGTNVPSSTLDVRGNNGVVGTFAATTELEIYVDNNEVSFRADADNDENDTVITFDTDGSERMRIDNNGKVGLGTTSPEGKLTLGVNTAHSDGLYINNASSGGGELDLVSLGTSYSSHGASGGEVWFYSSDNINIGSASSQNIDIKLLASGSKRAGMRRFVSSDSANVWCWDVGWNAWGTTRSTGLQVGGHRYYHSAMEVEDHDTATSYSGTLIQFRRNGNDCGEIVSTGATSCSYSTSSDYRIKQDIDDLDIGIDVVKKLKPRKFKFKSEENQKDDDGKDVLNETVHGFIAHEVQETITNSKGLVNGTKDETKDLKNIVLNKDGNVIGENVTEEEWKKKVAEKIYSEDTIWKASHTNMVTQSMDYGKLTPLLTKALQEAIAKIEVLEAKVTVLESK